MAQNQPKFESKNTGGDLQTEKNQQKGLQIDQKQEQKYSLILREQ